MHEGCWRRPGGAGGGLWAQRRHTGACSGRPDGPWRQPSSRRLDGLAARRGVRLYSPAQPAAPRAGRRARHRDARRKRSPDRVVSSAASLCEASSYTCWIIGDYRVLLGRAAVAVHYGPSRSFRHARHSATVTNLIAVLTANFPQLQVFFRNPPLRLPNNCLRESVSAVLVPPHCNNTPRTSLEES